MEIANNSLENVAKFKYRVPSLSDRYHWTVHKPFCVVPFSTLIAAVLVCQSQKPYILFECV